MSTLNYQLQISTQITCHLFSSKLNLKAFKELLKDSNKARGKLRQGVEATK